MAPAALTHQSVRSTLVDGLSSPAQADPLVPTVYHEPWWLEIVTGGRWTVAEVREGGRIVGRMPYQVSRRFGVAAAGMPPLTHFLGPAVDAGQGSAQARYLRRVAITRELIRCLPQRSGFWQKFHRGVTDVIAFQAERFETGVQFTFEVAPAPEAVLWAALRDKHRNVIRKARKQFAIHELDDSGEFVAFYLANLRERMAVSWVPAAVLANLLTAATSRGCGEMLGLRDERGRLTAAVFCARDHEVSYYTLSTRSFAAGNGGVPLLIWESIRRAARDGLLFDFDGLSAASSIGLYAGFGAVTSPRFIATRSPAARVLRLARRRLGLKVNEFGG